MSSVLLDNRNLALQVQSMQRELQSLQVFKREIEKKDQLIKELQNQSQPSRDYAQPYQTFLEQVKQKGLDRSKSTRILDLSPETFTARGNKGLVKT